MKWAGHVPLLTLAMAGVLLLRNDVAAQSDQANLLPYQARYQVLRNGSTLGQAVVTLAREGNGKTWRLRSETRGTQGLAALARVEIVEDSHFRLRDGRPETLDYSFHQKAAWKNRERTVKVDAAAGTILSTDKERSHSFAYAPRVIDRHLVTVALALDLARGEVPRAKHDLVYRVVDRDELEDQRYMAGRKETLSSPLGGLRTLRLTRVRENPGRVTDSWLAIDRGFVPVKVVQREPDGETFELRLLALKR
ncbi:MAG: DUF3108 domain-containing protein [Lysobacterales bacterium]